MKMLGGFGLALLFAAGVFAQNQSGFINQGYISRGFSSAVFPGGTSAMPGVQRFTPSVTYPGGGGPRIAIPAPSFNLNFGSNIGGGFSGPFFTGQNAFGSPVPSGSGRGGQHGNRGTTTVVTVPYAYPMYVGGSYFDPSVYGGYGNAYSAPPADGSQPQQPNVIIVYPSQQSGPVIVTAPPPGGQAAGAPGTQPGVYQAPQGAEAAQEAAPESAPLNEAPHYLIALKDHTIYSAIAYWVDGDTLHYFTSGNTHNQVSLSLVDRDLTNRLNKESGIDMKLPPAGQ